MALHGVARKTSGLVVSLALLVICASSMSESVSEVDYPGRGRAGLDLYDTGFDGQSRSFLIKEPDQYPGPYGNLDMAYNKLAYKPYHKLPPPLAPAHHTRLPPRRKRPLGPRKQPEKIASPKQQLEYLETRQITQEGLERWQRLRVDLVKEAIKLLTMGRPTLADQKQLVIPPVSTCVRFILLGTWKGMPDKNFPYGCCYLDIARAMTPCFVGPSTSTTKKPPTSTTTSKPPPTTSTTKKTTTSTTKKTTTTTTKKTTTSTTKKPPTSTTTKKSGTTNSWKSKEQKKN